MVIGYALGRLHKRKSLMVEHQTGEGRTLMGIKHVERK